jgi:hypothetical protein
MKMYTLVIHAPDYTVIKQGKKSFDAVVRSGVGVGYAIFPNDVSRLSPGSKVILLRKDKRQQRAEGQLVKLVPTNKYTHSGIQRYDVHIIGLKLVPYKPERLNHYGVALLDC